MKNPMMSMWMSAANKAIGTGRGLMTAEMRRLMDDPAEIDRVLKAGAERAAEVADPVVDEVKKIVGFWRA